MRMEQKPIAVTGSLNNTKKLRKGRAEQSAWPFRQYRFKFCGNLFPSIAIFARITYNTSNRILGISHTEDEFLPENSF